MQMFYIPDINRSSHTLDAEESKHCVKVLRMRAGQTIHFTDGRGAVGEAVIVDANPRACVVQLNKGIIRQAARSPVLHMAVAPTKNTDRFEWFLEKATECGLDEITPVICENSERTVVKPDRLEKIMLSAMKQSLRFWLPVLNPPIPFHQFLKTTIPHQRFIAWCGDTDKLTLQQAYKAGEHAVIMIGPEGDFSQEEYSAAREAGFQAIGLGLHRLRTETAALVSCIGFNQINHTL
jgi:16S rRNA (uracil1498-N3)-methyltransferase